MRWEGVGLAAALRWGPDFETVIDKSSRIAGDSDSVACIAGLFLGAWCCESPAPWLDHLPERGRREQLASGPARRSGSRESGGPRRSPLRAAARATGTPPGSGPGAPFSHRLSGSRS